MESLLFFHPAVWWVSAWARLEREYCCDLVVVERTGRPRSYAETLAALAGAPALRRPSFAMALAERQVVGRIRRILEFHDHNMTMKLSRLAVVGAAALILGPIFALGVWASFTDHLVDGDRGSPTERAQVPATTTPDRAIPKRRARSEMFKATVRARLPNEPEWKPGPAPRTVPIRVQGHATDELGKPIGRVHIPQTPANRRFTGWR